MFSSNNSFPALSSTLSALHHPDHAMQTSEMLLLESCDVVCNIFKKTVKPDDDSLCNRPSAAEPNSSTTSSGVGDTPLDEPVLPVKASSEAPAAPLLEQQQQQQQPSSAAPGAPAAENTVESSCSAATITLGTSLFFARVPPTVESSAIKALFEPFGTVLDLNLFRPWATARTSKGCGIVVYESIASCVAAMNSLHNRFRWTGGETTMVVEWADPSRQRKENPNAKGVFEAKHKTTGLSGTRTAYKSQLKRALALGGCTTASSLANHPMPALSRTSSSSSGGGGARPLRGVLAMVPQLAAPPGAAEATAAWRIGVPSLQGAPGSLAFAAATAATHAGGFLTPSPDSSVLGSLSNHHHACYDVGMMPGSASQMHTAGWGAPCPSTLAPAAAVPGSVPLNYLDAAPAVGWTPALTAALLQQQQQALNLSGLGLASSAGSVPPCAQQASRAFDTLLQQGLQPEVLAYLSASAGLCADSVSLLTAARALAPQHAHAADGPVSSASAPWAAAASTAGMLATSLSFKQPSSSAGNTLSFAAAADAARAVVSTGTPDSQPWLMPGGQSYSCSRDNSSASLSSLFGVSLGTTGMESAGNVGLLMSMSSGMQIGCPLVQQNMFDATKATFEGSVRCAATNNTDCFAQAACSSWA